MVLSTDSDVVFGKGVGRVVLVTGRGFEVVSITCVVLVVGFFFALPDAFFLPGSVGAGGEGSIVGDAMGRAVTGIAVALVAFAFILVFLVVGSARDGIALLGGSRPRF